MRKKFLPAALLVSLSVASLSTLSSCKDTDQDFYDNLREENAQIDKRIDNLETRVKVLEDWKAALEGTDPDSSFDAMVKKYLQSQAGNEVVNAIITKYLQDNPIKECTCAEALEKINDEIAKLKEQLNNLVTGIILQSTVNPVFGTFALPIDLRSNILLAQYGYAETPNHVFPGSGFDATNVELDLSLVTPKNTFKVENGKALLSDAEDNAGRVYVTINPNDVNFEGIKMTLVNSLDEESGIKLGELVKSDKLLTFGYTLNSRADNGFYEAPAKLSEADIQSVKVDIEDGLGQAFKDALKNHTKGDIALLVKKLYDQFNGILPANALKVSYVKNAASTDKDGNAVAETRSSVYSEYALAATAYKPFSYKFLAGSNFDKIPVISPIDLSKLDFSGLKDKINFELSDITINLDGVNTNVTISAIENITLGKIKVSYEVPMIGADGKPVMDGTNVKYETKFTEVDLDDPDQATIKQNLLDALNSQFASASTDISDQLKDVVDSISGQIQSAVDDMVAQVNGQLKENIGDLVDELQNEVNNKLGNYVDKANKLIDKINAFTNRLNNILANPNHYLQVTMLYEGADGALHQLSNNAGVPSVFTVAGGNAIRLLPTSYTAEVVAPAFKKYVAVTNVMKDGKTAANDADCKSALDAANGVKYMNEVLDGRSLNVPFTGKAGYTYEITYQALDFHGYTSTQKFYVTVR